MIQQALGLIEKMRIEVRKAANADSPPFKTIFVQFNPETYTISKTVDYGEEQPMGASNGNLSFNKIEPEEINFDFWFDASGVAPPAKITEGSSTIPLQESIIEAVKPAIVNPLEQANTIEKELEEFKKLLTEYNGDTHEVNYLKLIWGGYLLDCRLTKMSINYTLFRNDGRPIRAKASCTFKGTSSYQLMQANANQQSSDITHIKTFQDDERLSLICEKIYNSNEHYIQIAQVNNLMSFRKIPKGNLLKFPPLKV